MGVGVTGWKRVVVAAAAGLLVASCGSDPDVTLAEDEPREVETVTVPADEFSDTDAEAEEEPDEPDEPSEPEPEPTEEEPDAVATVDGYFDALAASGGPSEAMLEFAEPGSAAEAYARFQMTLSGADRASGFGAQQWTKRSAGSDLEMCIDANCSTYSGFVADSASGLLEDFVVGDQLISTAIVGEQEPVTFGDGGMVQVVAAYEPASFEGVAVAIQIAAPAAEGTSVNIFTAEYVGADGVQSTVGNASGPVDLRAGANSPVSLFFEQIELGGTLYVDGWLGQDFRDGGQWEASLPLPTSAG